MQWSLKWKMLFNLSAKPGGGECPSKVVFLGNVKHGMGKYADRGIHVVDEVLFKWYASPQQKLPRGSTAWRVTRIYEYVMIRMY